MAINLTVHILQPVFTVYKWVTHQGKVLSFSMVGLDEITLTKHLIVKNDVKLAPCRFWPTFTPFKHE